ncbi:immunity 63 family protein [Aestuariibacter sp. AA17]|uniref:Immunity 63 family protein n=1 Tax=Fluctibacter corallii TaxID=2984329 RepID=A0ABT3A826_9ALTE|nr:immunity 63 family protein [Aestuariibacter sp. AA17]MCV2884724.1 immunity 63 family protein [Aestuariibacter sp. AA17]
MTKDIEVIREKVNFLGTMIGAPLEKLSLPDKPAGNGGHHIEMDDTKYHLVSSERGVELNRKTTGELDELLYWILSGVASELGYEYEKRNRNHEQDSRRTAFNKSIQLLKVLSETWATKRAKELESILESNPYDDDINKRVEYSKYLVSTGYAADESYRLACEKYPLPERGK